MVMTIISVYYISSFWMVMAIISVYYISSLWMVMAIISLYHMSSFWMVMTIIQYIISRHYGWSWRSFQYIISRHYEWLWRSFQYTISRHFEWSWRSFSIIYLVIMDGHGDHFSILYIVIRASTYSTCNIDLRSSSCQLWTIWVTNNHRYVPFIIIVIPPFPNSCILSLTISNSVHEGYHQYHRNGLHFWCSIPCLVFYGAQFVGLCKVLWILLRVFFIFPSGYWDVFHSLIYGS